MANTAGYDADARFIAPGGVKIDILNQEAGARVERHGCTAADSHGISFLVI